MNDLRGRPAPAGDANDVAFLHLAGACAIGAAVAGFLYSVAFIGLVVTGTAPAVGVILSSLALLVGAVLSVVVFAGLYRVLLDIGGGLTLLALLLGVTGAFGAAVHGGYDLAVAIHPPSADLGPAAELPNPIDPRGLLTFGVTGLAVLVMSSLIARSADFPRGLGYLGYLAGALLVIVYLGRLLILTPTHPLVAGPAALAGFVVNPAWYLWLGAILRRLGSESRN
jgi:hypothetical protein